jgi:VanZ family protein
VAIHLRRLLRWLPALAVMAVIFIASSLESSEIPRFQGVWDYIIKKAGHMSGYALLSLSYLWGLGRLDRRALWTAWILAVLYGASDELHQAFTPGRTPRPADVGFDAAGAAISLLAFSWYASAKRNKSAR